MAMVDMPELLWAFQSDGGRRGWLHTKPPQAIIDIPTAYVRADLHDAITEERDRLKEIVDGTGLATAAIAAERDRLAKQVDELQELFRIDGENHASVVRDLTNRHETRITKYAERIKELRDANAELLAGLDEYDQTANAIGSCGDGYCLVERPKGMHTNGGCRCAFDRFKAQRMMMAGQRLRNVLDKHKATSTEREGE